MRALPKPSGHQRDHGKKFSSQGPHSDCQIITKVTPQVTRKKRHECLHFILQFLLQPQNTESWLPEPPTFDELLYQRTVGALVRTVHDAVSYPRQVSHVAVPSSPLGPDKG